MKNNICKILLIFLLVIIFNIRSYAHPITSFPVYKNEPEYSYMRKFLPQLPNNVIAKIGNTYIEKNDYINWLLAKVGYKQDIFNTFIYWTAFQEIANNLSINPSESDIKLLLDSNLTRDIMIFKERNKYKYKISTYSNIRYKYYKKYVLPALVVYTLYTNVSYSEILRQLKLKYGVFNRKYKMKIIFLKFSPEYLSYNSSAYSNEIKYLEKKAKSILQKAFNDIKKGVPFEKAAEIYSDDIFTKYIGGFLGKFKYGSYGDTFDEVVKNLEPGDISEPIKSSIGFHIVKCLYKNKTGIYISHIQRKINRYEVINRHILISQKKSLIRKMKMILNKLKKGESFERLAKRYSDNYLSAYKYKSEVECNEFFEMLFAKELLHLKKGEVSDIIISDKGVQIIKIEDVKYTEFNEHTLDNVKKEIAFNKVMNNFKFYGKKLLKKIKISNVFRNTNYLFMVNKKKILKLDYGNWLYKYISSDVLLENYLSMLLFERKAKKMRISVTLDEVESIRKKRLIPDVPKNNKNPFIDMGFQLVLRELGSDLLASRILFKTEGIPDEWIYKKFVEQFGFLGIRYKVQFIVSFSGHEYAKNKITNIYKELVKGSSFANMAIKYSDDLNTGKTGGYIGKFKIEDWDFGVYKIINSLKINEISKPVETSDGYHIFYINNRKNGKIYISHIFISSILKNMKNYEKVKAGLDVPLRKIWYQVQKGNQDAKSLLTSYRDFCLSNKNEISWVEKKSILNHNYMLEKDKYYIIETKFGLHIVKILDIKTNKLTSKIRKSLEVDFYNNITDYSKILQLGLKLMKKNKTIYKEQNSDISVLKVF